jgi:uncharacterized membrane protein HdeD (DUF308 family)
MTDPMADADDLIEVSKGWWLYLVVGLLWIGFGWVVLSFNFTTVWAVAVFFGIGFILGGVMELVVSAQTRDWRWLHITFGIISIVAGVVAMVWPGETFLVLAAIIGWYVLIAGIADLATAFVTREDNDLWWLQLVLGIAQVMVGFWAVGYAGRSITLLVVWVGAAALARGISSIFFAFGLHRAGKELRARMTPAAAAR